MTDATFEKVSRSDKRLYGPPKLLLCGFSADVQSNFMKVLEFAGVEKVPRVWVTQDQEDTQISALLDLPDGEGAGVDLTTAESRCRVRGQAKRADWPDGYLPQDRHERCPVGNSYAHI